MITITPLAGLCNRMRALDSALALGKFVNTPVRLVWLLNGDLNCPFEELFAPIIGLQSVENKAELQTEKPTAKSGIKARMKKIRFLVTIFKNMRKILKGIQTLLLGFCKIFSSTYNIKVEDAKNYLENPSSLERIAKRKDLCISTWDRFYSRGEDFLDFHPASTIMEKINQYSINSRQIIGVHIRRMGPELFFSTHSPTEAFIDSMMVKYSQDRTIMFFLASDSMETERRLELEFPGRIIKQVNKNYSRDEPDGIKSAAIDLFCLASCKMLIGTYGSSFSETARDIGKIPSEIIDCVKTNSWKCSDDEIARIAFENLRSSDNPACG
jgi:hypothetical protein